MRAKFGNGAGAEGAVPPGRARQSDALSAFDLDLDSPQRRMRAQIADLGIAAPGDAGGVEPRDGFGCGQLGEGRFDFSMSVKGCGKAIAEESPEDEDDMSEVELASSDLLAVSVLGQLTRHPRVSALRKFIADWHFSHISVEDCWARGWAGPQERLRAAGDNLANVLRCLSESQPDRLNGIQKRLRRQIPRIERAIVEITPDGQLFLRVKDQPFEDPVLADFASDGTLKMLAYLIFLSDPVPPGFAAIESPEHFLRPQLLERLAETCRAYAESGQILVTTHSPYFVNALHAEELRVVWRDRDGFAKAMSTNDIFPVPELVEHGNQLGDLWMHGHFGVGNPTVRQGEPSGMFA